MTDVFVRVCEQRDPTIQFSGHRLKWLGDSVTIEDGFLFSFGDVCERRKDRGRFSDFRLEMCVEDVKIDDVFSIFFWGGKLETYISGSL